MAYDVDLKDLRFQLFDWLKLESILEHPKFADWDRENIEMVLEEALKIAQEQFDPANEPGDREGVKLEDDKVTVPEAYREPYKTLAEGGWVGCVNNPEYGGLGLPHQIGLAVTEFFAGSDVGASTSKAEPLGNGRYLISGEKIFITFGDHDMTDNVVHAVLARLPGAPQ